MIKRTIGLLFAASMLFASQGASADDDSLRNALQERQGKPVTLVLHGSEMTGTIVRVDADSVKLTQLVGKEFFDAVVDLDQVQAVVFRVK